MAQTEDDTPINISSKRYFSSFYFFPPVVFILFFYLFVILWSLGRKCAHTLSSSSWDLFDSLACFTAGFFSTSGSCHAILIEYLLLKFRRRCCTVPIAHNSPDPCSYRLHAQVTSTLKELWHSLFKNIFPEWVHYRVLGGFHKNPISGGSRRMINFIMFQLLWKAIISAYFSVSALLACINGQKNRFMKML